MLLLPVLLSACSDNENNNPTLITATPSQPTVTFAPLPTPTPTPIADGPHQPIPAFLRWAYYIPDDPDSQESLQANLGSLDVVSPAYFTIDGSGNVVGKDRPSVDAQIHAKHVKILPMLQNTPIWDDFHPFISDSDWVDKTVAKIVSLVNTYNYDGIQIDLEAINRDDGPNLTAFMAKLYANLHAENKLVTMAVGAKFEDFGGKFSGAYDYAALANVVDYVNIMAYDYSYPGGDPGPVAPIAWVQSVAEYAAAKFGARKVILGVPFYGYDWDVSQDKYAASRSYPTVLDMMSEYSGTIGYDQLYQSPYMQYTKDGDTHQIWFENEQSLAAKFNIVSSLKLGGFSAWRLGQDGPLDWNSINSATPPTARQNSLANTDGQYFPQTGHTLASIFKDYWQNNGGARIFGLPITDLISEVESDGENLQVQYFENARLEYHASSTTKILAGALGRELTNNQQNTPNFLPDTSDGTAQMMDCSAAPKSLTKCYSSQTKQVLANGFKTFWQSNGGLAAFGYPISREFSEVSPFDGKTYTVQYFERARFQYDNATGQVSLAPIGTQLLWKRGWMR